MALKEKMSLKKVLCILAALHLSETMGIGEIFGTVIVLSAALISELPERNNKSL